MKIGVLFSGGKDSTYSAWLAKKEGHELVCLITLFSENKDSFMFHTPLIELTKKQAELMNLPIIIDKTAGEKEKELADLERAIKKAIFDYKIEGIVTGAVASNYQASRIQKICDKLGIKCVNLLWGKNAESYWKEMLKNKFEIMIVGIASDGLSKEWLGKIIDKDNLGKLLELSKKFKFHFAFEGGEAETLVLNCPLFKKELELPEFNRKIEKTNTGRIELK
jgi:ABC transporter with metal-binding/Fe-S-binding domain ATP-binding protein